MSSQNPPLVRHSLFSIHAGGRIHISLTMFSLLLEGVAGVLVPACGCWRGRGESFVSNCGQSCSHEGATGVFGSCGTYLAQRTLRASHGVNLAGSKTLTPPCTANTCSKRQGYWLQVKLLPRSSLGLRGGDFYLSTLVAMGFFTANIPQAMSRLKKTASPLRFRRLYLGQSLAGSARPL